MTLDRDPMRSFRSRALAPACALLLAMACQSEKKTDTQVAPLAPANSTTGVDTAAAQPAAIGSTGAVTPKAAEPGAVSELALDPASSKLEIVASKITRSHDGSFKQFTGTATLAGDQVQSVNFDVDTASLQTDTEKLTQHIKTKDFLDVEKFPKATFKSSSVVAKPSGTATHEITGDLTLHGVTQQITFPATIELGPEKVTGRAEIAINRQKFGVTYPGMPDDLIKDEVVLKPSFVFPRKKS
ncbi:MAG TPA: YceI family protein [Polyangiaceae bacterium]|jgi:polyisoprenoid-binding protein YceI|nr:YceI family protein [Polyangiaceae bacterium]